jgi:ABC-2 type transport system ATP-binding protein
LYTPAILVVDLVRSFTATTGWLRTKRSEKVALNRISFSVEQGELFGLLGPNGAGKTTICKILATMLLPTSGHVSIMGLDPVHDPIAVRKRIGVVLGGDLGLYTHLSVWDNLTFWGALYQIPARELRARSAEAIEMLGLGAVANQRVEELSRGMRQRLHLARGVLVKPAVLLLDEPTLGLDPVAARSLREVVRQFKLNGATTLLTTHYMQEAEELCDRIAIIDRGEIRYMGTPADIKSAVPLANSLRLVADRRALERLRQLEGLPGVLRVSTVEADGTVQLSMDYEGDAGFAGQVIQVLGGNVVKEIHTREHTLEDAYVSIIGDRGLDV